MQQQFNKLNNALKFHQTGQLPEAYQAYLECLEESLEPSRQLDHSTKNIESQANQAEIYYLMALLTHDCQCYYLAHFYFEQALFLNPDSARYLEAQALTLSALCRDDEAIAMIQASLAIEPDQSEALLNLAGLYRVKKQFFRAVRLLQRLLSVHPSNGILYQQLADLYFEGEDYDTALKYVTEAIQLNSNPNEVLENVALSFLQGKLLVRLNHHEEAATLLTQLVQSSEVMGEHLKELGVLLYSHGQFVVAQQLLAQAMQALQMDGQIPIYLRAAMAQSKNPGCYLHLASKPHLKPEPFNTSVKMPWEVILVSPINFSLYGGGQNSTQVARCLYDSGHRFLFTQPSSNAAFADTFHLWENLFLFQDYPMTPYQRQQAEAVFKRFTSPEFPDKLLVLGIYSRYLVDLASIAKNHGYQTVYWCYDNWHAMKWPFKRSDSERLLAQSVDGVITTSEVLRQKMLNRYQRDTVVIRNGYSPEQFPLDFNLMSLPQCPADLIKTGEKTLLYWGHLASEWIDWDLLEAVVGANPQWTFNLIGKVNTSEINRFAYPNIHFLGEKNVEELYAYGRNADLGFIHFKDIPVIRAVNPVKAYEYLASGLPVVSTPMSELDVFPGVIQVRTVDEFTQAAKQLMNQPPERQIIVNFLSQQSWQARADELISFANTLS